MQPQTLFVRDRSTWLCYLLAGLYCFVMASFGPIMPYLRSEMQLSYGMAGLHFSAFALGALIAGLSGAATMERFGHTRTIWIGIALVMAGTMVVIFGQHPFVTISGALLVGLAGNQMSQSITALMSDRFQADRTIAIAETNISTAVCSSCAPLFVGAVVKLGLNWRFGFLLPFVASVVLAATNRTTIRAEKFEKHSEETQSSSDRFPLAYWSLLLVILFSVASEWSIVYWSADFLQKVGGLSKADAATSVSAFLVAMFTGRIIGSRLARSVPTRQVLPFAATLATAGFLTFWLGSANPVKIVGLFLAGLGESNMYPFSVSAAMGLVPGRSGPAVSRISISVGCAMLVAPLVLGLLADRFGIGNAYAMVAVLLSIAVCMVFVANRLASSKHLDTPTVPS